MVQITNLKKSAPQVKFAILQRMLSENITVVMVKIFANADKTHSLHYMPNNSQIILYNKNNTIVLQIYNSITYGKMPSQIINMAKH